MADSTEPSNKQQPAKDSAEAKRRRTAAYRERKKAQGISSVTLQVPEASHGLFQQAASLIRDGTEPGEAFRLAGGSVTGDGAERHRDEGDDAQRHRDEGDDAQRHRDEGDDAQRHRDARLDRIAAALEALTAESERQRPTEPDHFQALADLAEAVNRDRDQQRQRHGELLQAVTQAQGDAAALPEVLAALQRLEALTVENERQRASEAEHLQALAGLLVTIRRDQQEQRHENLIQTVTRESQRPGGPDHVRALAALVVTIRRDREQQHQQHRELLRMVRRSQGQRDAGGSAEVLAALAPLESVVDGLVAAQEADKELIDKLRDLLTPMVRLSFAIQAGEKDPVTG